MTYKPNRVLVQSKACASLNKHPPQARTVRNSAISLRNRILKILSLLPRPETKFLPQIKLPHAPSPLPSTGRIIDRTFTTSEDRQIVDEGAKQRTANISTPRSPHPPCMIFSKQLPAPSSHEGNKSRTEVSCAIEAAMQDSPS